MGGSGDNTPRPVPCEPNSEAGCPIMNVSDAAAKNALRDARAAIDGADTFFPGVHFSDWTEVSRVHHKADAEHAYDFDMVEYLRSA